MGRIITTNGLSKDYDLMPERPVFLKHVLGLQKTQRKKVLREVSFSVNEGVSLGIIGENGAGKSTLLKILAGIIKPTSGEFKIRGSVGSLIGLGAGFLLDLSGSENLFLNAAILGFSRQQVRDLYADIVDFSGIGDYIHQPVRTYSSGMVVRLAFSIAIHFDPDIILIDEVLAVGDEAFTHKCIERLERVRGRKTFIMVSHNLSVIERLCDQVLWLDNGSVARFGDPSEIVSEYLSRSIPVIDSKVGCSIRGSKEMVVVSANVTDDLGATRSSFSAGECLNINIVVHSSKSIKDLIVNLKVVNNVGLEVLDINNLWEPHDWGQFNPDQKSVITFSFKPYLIPGTYSVHVILAYGEGLRFYDWVENCVSFNVQGDIRKKGVIDVKPTFKRV